MGFFCRCLSRGRAQLSALKHELLTDGYTEADEQIRLFNNNRMPLKPGCDAIQVNSTP